MKYADREELLKAAQSLLWCLKEEADEDAQQHALNILNGLYGIAVARYVRIRDIARGALEDGR